MKKLITITTALMLAPVLLAQSADAPAKKKKAVSKKPAPYVRLSEAAAVSTKAEEPIVAFLLVDEDEKSSLISEMVLKRKEFMKDLARPNFVVWAPQAFKRDAAKKGKLDAKKMPAETKEFLEKTVVTPKMVEQARQSGRTPPEFDDANLYPLVLVLSPGGEQEAYRFPKFDADGGFAVWIMTIRDAISASGAEPVITKPIQKILDNPLADSKAANAARTAREAKKTKAGKNNKKKK